MPPSPESLRQAAVVMTSLGTDLAIEVCNFLDDRTVRLVAEAIARTSEVPTEERDRVLTQFADLCRRDPTPGGEEYAKQLLHGALGQSRYAELVASQEEDEPLELLKEMDARVVLEALEEEPAQALALVAARMPAAKAAELLEGLGAERAGEVVLRMATTGAVAPGVLAAIGRLLEEHADATDGMAGGVGREETVVGVLEQVSRATREAVFSALDEQDPTMGNTIRESLFSFEKVVHLDDRALETILRNVEAKEIAMALKGVPSKVRERLLSCLSERGRSVIEQEIEFLGRVRVRDVEDAQRKFVQVTQTLVNSGEISLGGDEEEEYVE